MRLTGRSRKSDFINGYKNTLIGDVLRRPHQIASLYPYMPKADARKSREITNFFGEDCRSEIQSQIIDPLHSALIKPGQNLTKVNHHIQLVQALFKAEPSKLADIATLINIDEPHGQAITAAKALISSTQSDVQTVAQLAFTKLYRGILETAQTPKLTIREAVQKLDPQNVIDTLLRPEKMVADVRAKYLSGAGASSVSARAIS
jgi:hypothetical protein